MAVTIKDIAAHLNMSYSTVSYALSGKGSIKQETRELIKNAARELGYVPNKLARQICTGKSNSVAILVPNVLHEYGEFCEHAFRQLSHAGYMTSICITEFSAERELHIIREVIGQGVAGIILIPTREALEAIKLIENHRIPLVCRGTKELPGANVFIDYLKMGKIIGNKLKENGRKNVCLAAPHPPPFSNNVTELMEGLRESYQEIRLEYLADENLPEQKDDASVNYHYENQVNRMLFQDGTATGQQMFRQLFTENQPTPDAVVCPHELCASGLMQEAIRHKINIPGELSIISGQCSLQNISSPQPITSVYVSIRQQATEMVGMLLNYIKSGKPPESITIAPEIFQGMTI